jgi:chondroitin 4-sulfotransferase 11
MEPNRSGDAARTAVLLEAQRAVYIEVPKVACSSIKIALASLLAIDLETAGGNPHHVSFPEARSQPGPCMYPGLFAFAFVRNPWDRLVSCYRDKIRGEVPGFTNFHTTRQVAYCLARFDTFRAGMTFDEFVEAVASILDDEADDHFRSQHTFLTNSSGELGLDYVGRFERLERDFDWVCQRLGLRNLTLPFVQAVCTPRNYTEFYTPVTRRLVGDRFGKDIDLFRYDFGSGCSSRSRRAK